MEAMDGWMDGWKEGNVQVGCLTSAPRLWLFHPQDAAVGETAGKGSCPHSFSQLHVNSQLPPNKGVNFQNMYELVYTFSKYF